VSNDIINQTYEDTFHEGEWEHVAIRFTIGDEEDESTWIPDLVNFYQHYYTVTVDAADCWWAPDGEPSEAEVLFDPDERTHLQIFIALNAHASYNRFQARYELDIADVEHYTDVLDYTTLEGSYFDYDYLINMGEPQNFLDTEVHVHTQGQTPYNYYDYHYVDDDSYPEFLSMSEETFFGKDFYAGGFGPITVETKPPHSPVVTGMGDGDPNVWTVFANGFNNGNNDHELVGTWDYRSVWLADPQNISVNTTWTTNQELDNPIIVTGGATLTIDKEGFLISTRGFWPQKIIIEDGSIVITENSSGQFSNIQLILMDNGEQDNTSQIRNISFTHYQRNIRHSLIVHKTLTNPIQNCNFNSYQIGGIRAISQGELINLSIRDCNFWNSNEANKTRGIVFYGVGDQSEISGCHFSNYHEAVKIVHSAPRIFDNKMNFNEVMRPWDAIGIRVHGSNPWISHNKIDGFSMGIASLARSCPRIEKNYITNNTFAEIFNSYSSPDLSNFAANFIGNPDLASGLRVAPIRNDAAQRPILYDGCNSITPALRLSWNPADMYAPIWQAWPPPGQMATRFQYITTDFNFLHFGRPGVLDQDNLRNNYWGPIDDWDLNESGMNPNCTIFSGYFLPGMFDMHVGDDDEEDQDYPSMARQQIVDNYGDMFVLGDVLEDFYPPEEEWFEVEENYEFNEYPDDQQDPLYAAFFSAVQALYNGNYISAEDQFDELQEDCQDENKFSLQAACLSRMYWAARLGPNMQNVRVVYEDLGEFHPHEPMRHTANSLVADIDVAEGNFGDAIDFYESVINDENVTYGDSIYAVLGAGHAYLTAASQVDLGGEDEYLDYDLFKKLQNVTLYGSIATLKPKSLSLFDLMESKLMHLLTLPMQLSDDNLIISSESEWGGHVLLPGDVTISVNGTLTILPGTKIYGNDINIIVEGKIVAVGTSSNPIEFHRLGMENSVNKWAESGISIILDSGSSNSSVFEHCNFNRSRKAIDYNVDLSETILGCNFTDCDTSIIKENSLVSSIEIEDCTFKMDSTITLYGPEINISYNSIGVSLSNFNNSILKGCTFLGPMQPVIALSGNLDIEDCYFQNYNFDDNEIQTEIYAIELHYSNGKLKHNTINGFPSGILLYDSDPLMYYNKIENCFFEGIHLVNDSYPDLTNLGLGGNNWLKENGSVDVEPTQIRIEGSVYPLLDFGHNNIWDADQVNGYAISTSVAPLPIVMLTNNYWGTANPVPAELFKHYNAVDFTYTPIDIAEQIPVGGYQTQSHLDRQYIQALNFISEGRYSTAIRPLRNVALNDTIVPNRIGAISLLLDCYTNAEVEVENFFAFMRGLADTTNFSRVSHKALHTVAQMNLEMEEYDQAIEYYESVIQQDNVVFADSICAIIDAGNVYLRAFRGGRGDRGASMGFVQIGKIESIVPVSVSSQKRKEQYLRNLLRGRNSTSTNHLKSVLPENIQLYQNYPNPFNGITTVKFDLPKNTNVRILVYDIRGRQIMSVLDRPLSAGFHSTSINMSNIASGMYFYRLEANNSTIVQKMILIK